MHGPHEQYGQVNGVLDRVEQQLNAGKAGEAIEIIRHCGMSCPEIENAYGVCLLRQGAVDQAVELFRRLVLFPNAVTFRSDVPSLYKCNFATALLLAGNVDGCRSTLNDIDNDLDPLVIELWGAIQQWKRTLNWWERLLFALGASPRDRPVRLEFPPGHVRALRERRSAA
jgi:hypothetical protein